MEGNFARSAMISRDRLAELSRLDPGRVVRIALFDLLVIAAAVVASERWWSPPVYALAVMVIGGRLVGMVSIGMHDGAHRLLARDRRRNDRLARLLVAPALVVDLLEYREQHFAHHRHVNAAADPDLAEYQGWYAAPPWRRAWRLISALLGLRVVLAMFRLVRAGAWPQRVLAIAIPAALVAGVGSGVTPLRLLALYWVVPLTTWVMFVNLLRAVAEHYPPGTAARPHDRPAVFRTRDVQASWFDAAFVVTRNVNYHLTHHLFPSVPFFRLPALHREIARTAAYRKNAHVTCGYHRVLWEVVFDRVIERAFDRVSDRATQITAA
jgi:fatty acid desaturase